MRYLNILAIVLWSVAFGVNIDAQNWPAVTACFGCITYCYLLIVQDYRKQNDNN